MDLFHEYLRWLLALLIGCSFGSFFANLIQLQLIERPIEPSIIGYRLRSRCDHCRRTLNWFENVPILAWFVLRGHCRSCRQPINPLYPVVEILSVCVAMISINVHVQPVEAFLISLLGMVLLHICWIDSRHLMISDTALTWLLVVTCALLLTEGSPVPVSTGLQGALTGFLLLEVCRVAFLSMRGYSGLGAADPKLMLCLGLLMHPEHVLHAISLAGILALVYWLFEACRADSVELRRAIPFAPFLVAGALGVHGIQLL